MNTSTEINIHCDFCGSRLEMEGGILLSPPQNKKWAIEKRNLCIRCYNHLIVYMTTARFDDVPTKKVELPPKDSK